MLRKNKDNQAITKRELRQELGDFTEKILLPSMQEIFMNKEGFEHVLEQKLEEKLDTKFDEKLDEKLKPMKNEILDGQDKICKQLTDLQDENKTGTNLYKKQDEKLENHEKRISALELKPSGL
ncbi:MAG: hypothetical protein U9P63_02970 [Patescibacteria group bacterium]|nr:hypothetical protein [Patescibacteria group bacterium]